ncbi:MAG: hypothetical protein ACRDTC_27715, partial [Pseudonocardiaceae bacterium]
MHGDDPAPPRLQATVADAAVGPQNTRNALALSPVIRAEQVSTSTGCSADPLSPGPAIPPRERIISDATGLAVPPHAAGAGIPVTGLPGTTT